MNRTVSVDVDKSFDVPCTITKSYTRADGRRVIRGVASGILEDRDGERVSKRAIAEMASQPVAGMKLVAGTHEQNWTNEMGEVLSLEHDAETDELICEALLPPEGEDPLADKAWKIVTSPGGKLGYSIGGKLTSCFHELVERGGRVVKRKVLDGVALRHMCLTEKPSYGTSLVEAVAKTASSIDLPEDLETFEEAPGQEAEDAAAIVAKAAPAPDEKPEATEQAPAEEQTPDDPAGEGDAPEAAGDDDAEETPDLPKGEGARHLACPNCGHEFAAELPADGPVETPTTDSDEEKTMKTAEETLAEIRSLAAEVDGTDVAKTEDAEAPEVAEVEVEKTTEEPSDVEKMIAASHAHNSAGLEAMRAELTEGFELVAKTMQAIHERVAAMPQGRKSRAAVIPSPNDTAEVKKTATETDDVAKAVDEAPDALTALRILNAARGIE